MSFFDDAVDLARQEAQHVAPAAYTTHIVEDTSRRVQVFTAICGASIHSSEIAARTSWEPTCTRCKNSWDEFNGDDAVDH